MSEIITFYSYKGGVGRTMALANVSVMLSKWGHSVLVVDWDLEAPGLEHFYKDYIEDIKVVETKSGVIDLLQINEANKWQDDIIEINIPNAAAPIHLISSGKRDEHYFKKVRGFDVDVFYENSGGDVIERLRNEWLANYDYVLIDSRTGITEIGGICTIQLPDTVVMLFTATNQGFDGVLDIISRASAAQQKLSYDRQKLIFLPIPSKFETNTEFKLSQEWLEIFAARLQNTYNDWLPASIDRKDFLELTKIPYIAYFSFGEKLPVIEQGVKDPSGLGYAYETLSALIANHLNNVDWLFNNRDQYISDVNKYPTAEPETRKHSNGNNDSRKKLSALKHKLNISEEPVKLEKNKEVIINCTENNILPLLESLSTEMKIVGSFFKNKNEKIELIGESHEYYHRSTTSLEILSKEIDSYYSSNIDFELNSINYSCNFQSLRRSQNLDFKVLSNLSILFHQSVYEIKSDELGITIDKLYHETLSVDETENIVQAVAKALVEKIENATKE